MLGKERIGPALRVTSTAMSTLSATAAQNAPQTHPHQAVNSVERIAMAVFEVTKPALRGAIHIRDDYLQTLPIGAFGLGSNRIFHLLQTLSARPSLPALEMISQKVEAPGWVAPTIRVFSGCRVRPAVAIHCCTTSNARWAAASLGQSTTKSSAYLTISMP